MHIPENVSCTKALFDWAIPVLTRYFKVDPVPTSQAEWTWKQGRKRLALEGRHQRDGWAIVVWTGTACRWTDQVTLVIGEDPVNQALSHRVWSHALGFNLPHLMVAVRWYLGDNAIRATMDDLPPRELMGLAESLRRADGYLR